MARTVPADRLLVMSVKDGWEPLCRFLGKPVPNAPFPHANEAAAVEKIMPRVMVKVLGVWLALAGVAGAVAYGLWATAWRG